MAYENKNWSVGQQVRILAHPNADAVGRTGKIIAVNAADAPNTQRLIDTYIVEMSPPLPNNNHAVSVSELYVGPWPA